MKKINRIIIGIGSVMLLLIVGINLYMVRAEFRNSNRSYRVSTSRAEKRIDKWEGTQDFQDYLSEWKRNRKLNQSMETQSIKQKVWSVTQQENAMDEVFDIYFLSKQILENGEDTGQGKRLDEFLSDKAEDYVIYATAKGYYRITYERKEKVNTQTLVAMNLVAGVLVFGVLGILLYVRNRIIQPFTQMSELPYELCKGNLTMPIYEQKSRYFAHFLWGMNLLRENIEEDKKKELELVKEKKTLLMSLSHDIKTPLSAIKLYAKALERNLYHDEQKRLLIASNINQKADEIEGYIAEIVKASNEDFLSFEVQNAEFYMREPMEQIRLYYEEKMLLNQIQFAMKSYDNCIVSGDKDRLVEVMQNIIENAIKYGDGKKITISTARDEEEYVVSITNTGCTLEERELPHLFDSFFRGSNVGNNSGSGLGLYICRKLMHLMEGEITAQMIHSKDGEEMCLKIFLRLA